MGHAAHELIARSPFDAWPVHHVFGEEDGRIWLAEDGAICVQLLRERGDIHLAKRYVGAVRAIRALHPERTSRGGLRLFQDFQRIRIVDKEARDYLTVAAARDFTPSELRFNKLAIADELVLVRIALWLHTNALTRLGLSRIESVRDLGAELTRHGIHGPMVVADLDVFRNEFNDAYERLRDR